MGLNLLRPEFALYAVPALFSAVLGFASVYLWISSLAFWTGKNRPLVWIVFRISDFRRYPFSIYSTAIRALLVTLVPLAFASFFPATFFLEREGWRAWQLASLVAGPVAFFLAYRFWEFGLSNYSSTGS
jgi:ABC-2 type transport system permease protein